MVPGQGVPLVEILICLFGYADDVSIAEYGDDNGILRIEDRVNYISRGSSDDADMNVNIEKQDGCSSREGPGPGFIDIPG